MEASIFDRRYREWGQVISLDSEPIAAITTSGLDNNGFATVVFRVHPMDYSVDFRPRQ